MRISDWCSYLCSSDLAFLYLDARYQSRANLSYSATTAPDYFQDGYALVNGRIGIGDIDGRITLEAWARNLFNKRVWTGRSEEHTSELQSLMRTSYAVFCLKRYTIIHEIGTNHSKLMHLCHCCKPLSEMMQNTITTMNRPTINVNTSRQHYR